MGFDKRVYHKGEKPAHFIGRDQGSYRYHRYLYLRIGEVLEIDPEVYRMKIRWITGSGVPAWMPITFAYNGPSGCIGAMPEEHAVGIFGYYDEGTGKGSPVCLGYIPAGMLASFNYNVSKISPDAVPNEDANEILYRFRKLNAGDMIMASPRGGSVFVNNNIEIADSKQNSFVIRETDGSVIHTSINNFMFADGASVRSGPIIRNSMMLFDENGNRITGTNARELKKSIYIVPFGNRIEYDSQFYTEYRIDVDERGDGAIDSNDINDRNNLSLRDPIVSLVLGNYVGNDIKEKTYGAILRPVLFSSRYDKQGSFDLIQCAQNKGVDEVSTAGLAYALHFLKSGTFMGVDKEGHYYLNLAATQGNPIGSGRSMSVLAQGNLKEIWGYASEDGNSWDLTTKGGIRWYVGQHNTVEKSRSIHIQTSSGMYLEVGGADEDGFAKQENIFGDTSIFTGGNKTEVTLGTDTLTVDGLKTEHIMGSASETVDTDKSINVSGIFTEVAIKEKQCRFGTRKTTITSGNDELEIIKGDLTETIKTFGNRKTTLIGPGNIEEMIMTGDRKTTIVSGSYKITLTGGDMNIVAPTGTVSIIGTKMEVTATSSVTIKSPSVELGFGPTGGVVTGSSGTPSHFDYVTGAPLKGAMTVKAGA